jgi:hypothetical protein
MVCDISQTHQIPYGRVSLKYSIRTYLTLKGAFPVTSICYLAAQKRTTSVGSYCRCCQPNKLEQH